MFFKNRTEATTEGCSIESQSCKNGFFYTKNVPKKFIKR